MKLPFPILLVVLGSTTATSAVQDYEGYVEEETTVASSHIRRLERKVSRLETKCPLRHGPPTR
jgi:hypothetical protein